MMNQYNKGSKIAASVSIRWLILLFLFCISSLLVLVKGVVFADTRYLWTQALSIIVAICALLLGYRTSPRVRAFWLSLLFGAYFLMIATIAIRVFHNPAFSVLPGLENDQNLAANVVLLATSLLLLLPNIWWMQVLTVLALLLTSSRVALVAFFAAWFVLSLLSKRYRMAFSSAALVVVTALLLYGLSSLAVPQMNLLAFSNRFSSPVWYKGYAKTLEITPRVFSAPIGEGYATLIQAASDPASKVGGLVLFQAAPPNKTNDPFTASIYLRADTPQQLILTNNLGARVRCEVTTVWERCVTSAIEQNKGQYPQFKLYTVEPEYKFRVYAWGAQLERGDTATDVQLTQETWLERLLYSLGLGSFSSQDSSQDLRTRFAIFRKAWQVFLAHPLAGVGWGGLDSEFAKTTFDTPVSPHHAHNLALQLLAETGLLGFSAWAIMFFGSFVLCRQHWKTITPLFLAVLILNAVDFTFYTNLAYYSFWLTLGLLGSPRIKVSQ